jgi:N-acetylglucosaminyldiphosphoundecaprenol N-acetyl-beta-D-mannosaminyltransferase
MNLANNRVINILGVNVGTQSLTEMIEFIHKSIDSKDKVIIQYININAINIAQTNSWFKSFVNNTSMSYCDGVGIKLAARILGYSIPERYTIPDWFPQLASSCDQRGYSIYLLGAKPGVAEIAGFRLREKISGLIILSTHHGYFNKTHTHPENRAVVESINRCNPDILAVGLGMPLQEQWLKENWDQLNCRVAIPMGAAIDYLAGTTPRAPQWMTDNGLEWLGRLAVEPGRLWKRYILGIPSFYLRVFQQRLGYYPGD